MSLFDRLLGRTKKDPAPGPTPTPTTPQLGSVDVADPSTLPVGSVDVPAATLHLTAAASADTFVSAVSSSAASLMVTGGGVTVPSGQSSAPVLVTVIEAGASVPITFTLGTQTLQATILTGA